MIRQTRPVVDRFGSPPIRKEPKLAIEGIDGQLWFSADYAADVFRDGLHQRRTSRRRRVLYGMHYLNFDPDPLILRLHAADNVLYRLQRAIGVLVRINPAINEHLAAVRDAVASATNLSGYQRRRTNLRRRDRPRARMAFQVLSQIEETSLNLGHRIDGV